MTDHIDLSSDKDNIPNVVPWGTDNITGITIVINTIRKIVTSNSDK
jgi:hypothetical protein